MIKFQVYELYVVHKYKCIYILTVKLRVTGFYPVFIATLFYRWKYAYTWAAIIYIYYSTYIYIYIYIYHAYKIWDRFTDEKISCSANTR